MSSEKENSRNGNARVKPEGTSSFSPSDPGSGLPINVLLVLSLL